MPGSQTLPGGEAHAVKPVSLGDLSSLWSSQGRSRIRAHRLPIPDSQRVGLPGVPIGLTGRVVGVELYFKCTSENAPSITQAQVSSPKWTYRSSPAGCRGVRGGPAWHASSCPLRASLRPVDHASGSEGQAGSRAPHRGTQSLIRIDPMKITVRVSHDHSRSTIMVS